MSQLKVFTSVFKQSLRECTEIVSTGIEMPFYDDKTGLRRFPSPRRRAL
jgi:hypothetical protein